MAHLSDADAWNELNRRIEMAGPILNSRPIETSTDNGTTWTPERRCSDLNQVRALARGFREFATHRSRAHEYPHGIRVRWNGSEVLP
jgi:hypothetical protein